MQARFGFSAADLAAARDPIITVGDARMRFEGFSQCAGVYARVDVLPDGLLGDIAQPGTTNVDFNAPMLAALGLLGYDLHLQQWFYRQLPFKPERLTRLHPRLRGAQALLEAGLVRIGERQGQRVVATVQGTGVTHTVVIDGDALPPGAASATAPAAPKTSELHARCTCEWHLKHAGARGACKHILAVRQLLQGDVLGAGEAGPA